MQNAWEPRTPASVYDSSGGETPTTPQIDSNGATPDTNMANKFGRLGTADTFSPRKPGRRDSWWKRLMPSSPSPTKERDLQLVKEPQHYSKKAENRIVKRRSERAEHSRSKKRAAPHGDKGDDSDSDQPRKPAAVKHTFAMSLGGLLSWVEAHPNLPSVLSYYLQLTVNTCLGFLFLYIVYSAWRGVMIDVEIESSKHMAEIMVEISACNTEYTRNRCRPEEVVPAMEKACGVWEACMRRDPLKVARASVTAKTFAMIFNSFVEEFSYKSMVRTVMMKFVFVLTKTRSLPSSSFSAASTSPTGPLGSSVPSNPTHNKRISPATLSLKPRTASPATTTSTTTSNPSSKTGNSNNNSSSSNSWDTHHTTACASKRRRSCTRKACLPCRPPAAQRRKNRALRSQDAARGKRGYFDDKREMGNEMAFFKMESFSWTIFLCGGFV